MRRLSANLAAVVAGGAGIAAALIVFAVDGGRTETIETTAREAHPRQAPRGRIAFVRNGRLWLVNADGTRHRSTGFHATDFPVWSPDGRRIAFNSGGPRARIWVADPERRWRRPLTPVGAYDCSYMSWSPSGRRIAYTINEGCEGALAVFVVNRDGTARRRLQRDYGNLDQAWSPDGRFILFGSFPLGRPDRMRFFIVRTAGGQRRPLRGVTGSTDGWPRRPVAVWARNGTIYIRSGGLIRIKPDGSARRTLINTLTVHDFALSPDQRRIVLAADDGRRRDIYVINTNGSGLRKLTDAPSLDNKDPQWSPDGRHIAFLRLVRGGASDVYVMKADGTELRNITNHPAVETAPTWTPNGRRSG